MKNEEPMCQQGHAKSAVREKNWVYTVYRLVNFDLSEKSVSRFGAHHVISDEELMGPRWLIAHVYWEVFPIISDCWFIAAQMHLVMTSDLIA